MTSRSHSHLRTHRFSRPASIGIRSPPRTAQADRSFIAEATYSFGKITGTGVYDGRSVAEKILEAIDAAMLGKATKDQQSYVIQSGHRFAQSFSLGCIRSDGSAQNLRRIVAAEKRSESGTPLFKRHKFGFVAIRDKRAKKRANRRNAEH
jgi:hypothetical protein